MGKHGAIQSVAYGDKCSGGSIACQGMGRMSEGVSDTPKIHKEISVRLKTRKREKKKPLDGSAEREQLPG